MKPVAADLFAECGGFTSALLPIVMRAATGTLHAIAIGASLTGSTRAGISRNGSIGWYGMSPRVGWWRCRI